jgi:hypothetical protein
MHNWAMPPEIDSDLGFAASVASRGLRDARFRRALIGLVFVVMVFVVLPVAAMLTA